MKRKIKEHSGDIISYKGVNSIAEYFVMNDGSSQWKGLVLGRGENNKFNVSHRWISRCIEMKQVLSLRAVKALDLLPLPFATPYKGFGKYSFCFTLFSLKDQEVLKNLTQVMGANCYFF